MNNESNWEASKQTFLIACQLRINELEQVIDEQRETINSILNTSDYNRSQRLLTDAAVTVKNQALEIAALKKSIAAHKGVATKMKSKRRRR